ncbi:MAG: DUF1178 family protein [Burkholderiales bacterium]|nr:DUF1178 family protein [Burkholderiales bacterium]
MIVFNLHCADGHRFEGWFASARDFAAQRKRGLLSCPACGSSNVERGLSAPRLNMGAREPVREKTGVPSQVPAQIPAQKTPEMDGKDAFAVAQILYSRMLDEVLTKSEDVGNRFPDEARRIFYKQAEGRPIRGQATREEHDELVEEGIPVARLPVPSRDQLN